MWQSPINGPKQYMQQLQTAACLPVDVLLAFIAFSGQLMNSCYNQFPTCRPNMYIHLLHNKSYCTFTGASSIITEHSRPLNEYLTLQTSSWVIKRLSQYYWKIKVSWLVGYLRSHNNHCHECMRRPTCAMTCWLYTCPTIVLYFSKFCLAWTRLFCYRARNIRR